MALLRVMLVAHLVCFLACSGGGDDDPVLRRGPYLQQLGHDRVLVCWGTEGSGTGRLEWRRADGTTWQPLVEIHDQERSARNHTVEIAGLDPATDYRYRLVDLPGEWSFRTQMAPDSSEALRIWVIGDSGTADASARAVYDAYRAWTGATRTDVWLMLGDNAYKSGTDPEYQRAVFDIYGELLATTSPWPTFGNHDGYSIDPRTGVAPYYHIFDLPTAGECGGIASGTEAWYAFDVGPVHFVCLDSFASPRHAEGAMYRWLERDLTAHTGQWLIAFWHHPPYSKGSHDSDSEHNLIDMRETFLPLLEAHGVDLVLCGHSHSYERSHLLDGHYGHSSTLQAEMILDDGDGDPSADGAYAKPGPGPTPRAGAVYVVAGSSGKITGGSLDHPVMCRSLNVLGSVVIDIVGDQLDMVFLDDAGAVGDRWRLVRSLPVTERGGEG